MFLGLEKFSVSGLDLVAPKPARWLSYLDPESMKNRDPLLGSGV